jgi:hypothetical protein
LDLIVQPFNLCGYGVRFLRVFEHGYARKNNHYKKQKIMKRYIVEMNDGEFLKDFHQLKDAKAYRAKENFNYISRYVRIYDRKKGHYIC